MNKPQYVYVTYIASTLQKVWEALLQPEVTRQYWLHENLSDWKPGSKWEHRDTDAARTLLITGTVLECEAPRHLLFSWSAPADAEQHSRVSFDLELVQGSVRLTVTHTELQPGELEQIGVGWPMVLCSLKTLLETGRPLPKLWSH